MGWMTELVVTTAADEDVLADASKKAELAALVAPAKAVFLDAKVESELVDLEPEEALELLQSLGQEAPEPLKPVDGVLW